MKKIRSLGKRIENRSARHSVYHPRRHTNERLAVLALHFQFEVIFRFIDFKFRGVMYAGKNLAANQPIQRRIRVAARNKNTLTRRAVFIPFHGDAMCGIFRSQSAKCGQEGRADSAEPNETNASHAPTTDQLWAERRRQQSGKHIRLAAKIDKHPALNYSAYHRQMKKWLMNRE
ncbi:MAG: hypothetical protein PHY43_08450 [Verrucomicrobiales bacterium]|nr:hypothetical protein [Verrucomicrobiales bacterium]